MSYDAYETSAEGGSPVEAYAFEVGSTTYRYTSSESAVTIASLQYEPIAIRRERVSIDGRLGGANMAVTIPSDDALALLFQDAIPGSRVFCTIYRYHRDDTPTPEVLIYFQGYVRSVSFDTNAWECSLTVAPDVAGMSKSMPRHGYQSQCNHVLYQADCGVSEASYKVSAAAVTATDGYVVTVPAAALEADGYYTGGFVATTGSGTDYRMIIKHAGDELTLLLPFPEAQTELDLYAGCAHTLATCVAKFSNGVNFGGCAFVPTRNPFAVGLT